MGKSGTPSPRDFHRVARLTDGEKEYCSLADDCGRTGPTQGTPTWVIPAPKAQEEELTDMDISSGVRRHAVGLVHRVSRDDYQLSKGGGGS